MQHQVQNETLKLCRLLLLSCLAVVAVVVVDAIVVVGFYLKFCTRIECQKYQNRSLVVTDVEVEFEVELFLDAKFVFD